MEVSKHTHIETLLIVLCFYQDFNGQTPLHICASEGHAAAIRLLVSNGASVNVLDKVGNSPLHLASRHGHELFVMELLNHGGDPFW